MRNRRPIASRETGWAQWLTRVLCARAITPNQISILSMVFALAAGLAIYAGAQAGGNWRVFGLLLGAVGCQLRLLCNLMDGLVAVEGGQGRPDGVFWNETTDRVSDLLILLGLGYGLDLPGLGWAAAAASIGTAYIRELGRAITGEADFRGPMAKPQRMAVVTGAAFLAGLVYPFAGFWVSDLILVASLWMVVLGSGLTAIRRSVTLRARLQDET